MRGMLLLGLLLVPSLALADAGDQTRFQQMRRSWKDKATRSILGQMVHGVRDRVTRIWHMREARRTQRQRNTIAKALWSVRHPKTPFEEHLKDLLRVKIANWKAGKCTLNEVEVMAMQALAERRREEDRKRTAHDSRQGKRSLQIKLASIRRVEGRRLQVFTELPPGRLNQLRHLWKQMLVRPAPVSAPIAFR